MPSLVPASSLGFSRAVKVPVPQAFLQFADNGGRAPPLCRDRAPRACGRAKVDAKPCTPRAIVIHHSLSGFAVFCVVL
jgi:hypothetical protein